MMAVQLPFLNRERELTRLGHALDRRHSSLLCLYGRRRLGKSRLLRELLAGRQAVYYVGDERDGALQREAVGRAMATVLPGFADVAYPTWDALLDRWWQDAPAGASLALDEFPLIAAASPELPGILQKLIDQPARKARKTLLCGSSQRMMLGLLLDATAPLYGRAEEIIKVEPLGLKSLAHALRLRRAGAVVEAYAVWGGVPRYWELALDYPERRAAVEALLLDPMGVLHREPERLLLDDMQDVSRAASILALVGHGCHRVSEIAARLGQPATNLSRPIARLLELGFVSRAVPFGHPARDTKRSLYQIADPLLRFWFRFVEPHRSELAVRQLEVVRERVDAGWPHHLGSVWEDLARASVPSLVIDGARWSPATRWWGRGGDGEQIEIDVVATAAGDTGRVLVGEAKLSCAPRDLDRLKVRLLDNARSCPALRGKSVTAALWVLNRPAGRRRDDVLTAVDVLGASPA
jgi:hypothetical protein